MLQTTYPPSDSLRKHSLDTAHRDMNDSAPASDDEGDDIGGRGHSRGKSRRELPAGAVATLKAWLLSPEHFTHPYPTPQDQAMLMQKTGIDKKQLKNWFTNARRRIWKPMLKKQLEQGKLTTTGAGGAVAVPGVVPGLMVPTMPGGVQPALQQQPQHITTQQEVPVDTYGQSLFLAPGGAVAATSTRQISSMQPYFDPSAAATAPNGVSVRPAPPAQASTLGNPLSKTDSHAVLMELFARDQDLVKQATESSGMKVASEQLTSSQPVPSNQQQGQTQSNNSHQIPNQHPMRIPSQGRLVNVPTLNSWPHFSSVSSLNNLSTMPGVKSITSLSGVDLANQGPVNRVGNLAQVKSVESMGKNDSYAFLEVFFGDRNAVCSPSVKDRRGAKRQREEDNDIGLSLEDEGPSPSVKNESSSLNGMNSTEAASGVFMSSSAQATAEDSGTLKRAYDDALAAHGLISVSRSCEKLTDLALPAKIQRTLSQDYLGKQQQIRMRSQPMKEETVSHDESTPVLKAEGIQQSMHSGQVSHEQGQTLPDSKDVGASIEVPLTTICAVCHQTNVDTQLRPCGHMFHERCLKPTLQTAIGAPKCPIDHVPMLSALLAIPSDNVCSPVIGS